MASTANLLDHQRMGAWEYADLMAIGVRRADGEKQIVIVSSIRNNDPDLDKAASSIWAVGAIVDALNAVGALGWEVIDLRPVKRKKLSGFVDLVARLEQFSDGSHSVDFVTTYLLKRPLDPDNDIRVLHNS